MKNIKLHVCVMLMIVIAELIGVKSFSVGPGKIVLLPCFMPSSSESLRRRASLIL